MTNAPEMIYVNVTANLGDIGETNILDTSIKMPIEKSEWDSMTTQEQELECANFLEEQTGFGFDFSVVA